MCYVVGVHLVWLSLLDFSICVYVVWLWCIFGLIIWDSYGAHVVYVWYGFCLCTLGMAFIAHVLCMIIHWSVLSHNWFDTNCMVGMYIHMLVSSGVHFCLALAPMIPYSSLNCWQMFHTVTIWCAWTYCTHWHMHAALVNTRWSHPNACLHTPFT